MDPKTGAILGMASRPSFKLSQLNLDAPDFAIYRNRAVTDLYEPGSVIKSLTMATAIDLGLVNPNTTYFDSGSVEKGGYEFKNWDFSANGTTTMTQVLQYSLNTGAIWLSDLIGARRPLPLLSPASASVIRRTPASAASRTASYARTRTTSGTRPTSRPTATARASRRRRCR